MEIYRHEYSGWSGTDQPQTLGADMRISAAKTGGRLRPTEQHREEVKSNGAEQQRCCWRTKRTRQTGFPRALRSVPGWFEAPCEAS